MRGIKPSLVLASLGVIGLALWASAQVDRSGSRMASAAEWFLAALDDDQRNKASYDFDDDERFDWHFIPRERNGVPIKELNAEQRSLAFGLLNTGLSAAGTLKATTIMSLEAILRELENGAPRRDPELYYITVFGTPSNQGKWGWRVEGHHLSLNFTLDGGRIVSATPMFFGANPAEVRQGPREGLRTLAEREDRALRLVQALNDDQRKVAVVDEEAPGDIRAANTPQPPTEEPAGIPARRLNDDQQQMLKALVQSYATDMPGEVADAWLREVNDNGRDIHFAWFGPADRSQPHAYRVQGSTFLIEFNNTQNNANHIHSVWRNMLGDFGRSIQ